MKEIGTLVGTKVAVFKTDEGREITYGRVFILYDVDPEDTTVEGQQVEALKADVDFCNHAPLGAHGKPVYNRAGKCAGFDVDGDN